MSPTIVASIEELAGEYDALLCDVWGVYHNGVAVYASAAAALRRFRARGGWVVMLTNAPRPKAAVADLMVRVGGGPEDYDDIVTSGDAARESLRSGEWGATCYHLGPDRDLGLVTDAPIAQVGLDEAEFVLCTGLFDDTRDTVADYAELLARARARELPMLCSNPDLVVDRGEHRVLCAGSLALAYEQAGGCVTYYGKPHLPIYETAMRTLARVAGRPVDRSAVLAVGDGIRTDIAGAAAAGLDCVFVTGGLATGEIEHAAGRPDPASLQRYLAQHEQQPTAAMQQLA